METSATNAMPLPSDERRGADRPPDHVKRGGGCSKSECFVVPGEPTTRCCQRIVIPVYAQTAPHISRVDELQPGGFMKDFDLEPEWWTRRFG